ncbi:MAG: transposon-encoded TnpW family protein [Oscillospiraceae bacterium]|nr:transposon-encoded TnpW family protein [Oscillospiraceae bacterium]
MYTANAYFATNTRETLEDKILRLARNSGLDFQSENAEPMRTGQLPERSS